MGGPGNFITSDRSQMSPWDNPRGTRIPSPIPGAEVLGISRGGCFHWGAWGKSSHSAPSYLIIIVVIAAFHPTHAPHQIEEDPPPLSGCWNDYGTQRHIIMVELAELESCVACTVRMN